MTFMNRVTDADGRCMQLWPEGENEQTRQEKAKLKHGKLYKVIFQTKPYFEDSGRKCFYPWVDVSLAECMGAMRHTNLAAQITFEPPRPNEHYHIPLLLSPYSYTTYRGS
jgi:5-hydroxyisourate hydrolase